MLVARDGMEVRFRVEPLQGLPCPIVGSPNANARGATQSIIYSKLGRSSIWLVDLLLNLFDRLELNAF